MSKKPKWMTNLSCNHCKEKTCDITETFCKKCEEKIHTGILRICDWCNHSWEVEPGNCGYALKTLDDKVVELCKSCENRHLGRKD